MTKCVVGLHMYVNVEAETEARAHVAAAALVSGLPNLNDHAMEFAYVPHTWKKSRRSIFEHIPAATTSGMSNRGDGLIQHHARQGEGRGHGAYHY